MAGIYGAVGRPVRAERMAAALAHRGGLGTLPVAFDGRLDNGAELGPGTDAERVLRAYRKWGEDCPRHLLGDFAFAIQDGPRLFCARDPFGVRPFYYHAGPDLFAFATELKALLALPEVPRRLNETRIGDYLLANFEDKASTFYLDIRRLPPAHSLTVEPGRVRLRRYWSLDARKELRETDYVEAFREIFLDAVRCRLPGACFLSGGLDSSSIACAAARLRPPVRTYSAVFPTVPECDERRFIEAAVRRGGIEPRFVEVDRVSPLVDLDRVLFHQDEPFFEPNLAMDWALYGAARGEGAVLEGFDGDTTVSHGLAFLSELFTSGRWVRFARELRGVTRHLGLNPARVFLHRVVRPLLPRRRPRRPELLRPEFARRLGERPGPRPCRTERSDHLRLLDSGMLTFFLEVSDRAAAAFGLVPRYPFFDRRLVEFCLALPPDEKVRDGWTRWVLRRAMEGILPPEIQWREDKARLGANFERGFLAFERERVEEIVYRDGEVLRNYVNMPRLREAYRRYAQEGDRREAIDVWKAVTLALWLQRK